MTGLTMLAVARSAPPAAFLAGSATARTAPDIADVARPGRSAGRGHARTPGCRG